MRAYLETIESPAGPLRLAVSADGALLRIAFLEGRYPSTIEQELIAEGFALARDPARTAEASAQLADYAAGTRRAFDLPLALAGTPFERAVWTALLTIPFGETRSYGEIARQLDAPWAARAVGRANGANRIPLVIPCHRVIGADGSLTGFGGGLHLKSRLLAHEERVIGRPIAGLRAMEQQLPLMI